MHTMWRITIPTLFTLGRIGLIPFIINAIFYDQWKYAFLLFVIAAGTDIIDGFLARLMNDKTVLGTYLDPIADKLLLVSCFITLAFVKSPLGMIPVWFVVLLLLKELLLIIGGYWIFFRNNTQEIQPTLLGKLTTFMQIMFILWLFISYFLNWLSLTIYYNALLCLSIVICASLLQYAMQGLLVYRLKSINSK